MNVPTYANKTNTDIKDWIDEIYDLMRSRTKPIEQLDSSRNNKSELLVKRTSA